MLDGLLEWNTNPFANIFGWKLTTIFLIWALLILTYIIAPELFRKNKE